MQISFTNILHGKSKKAYYLSILHALFNFVSLCNNNDKILYQVNNI